MATADQIRERLDAWLGGEIQLDELNEWLTTNTWNVHQIGDPEATRLAFSIELRLAEYSAGHLDAEELRSELERLAHRMPAITVADYPFIWKSPAGGASMGGITKAGTFQRPYLPAKLDLASRAR